MIALNFGNDIRCSGKCQSCIIPLLGMAWLFLALVGFLRDFSERETSPGAAERVHSAKSARADNLPFAFLGVNKDEH